jgi:hypothetical protein
MHAHGRDLSKGKLMRWCGMEKTHGSSVQKNGEECSRDDSHE